MLLKDDARLYDISGSCPCLERAVLLVHASSPEKLMSNDLVDMKV